MMELLVVLGVVGVVALAIWAHRENEKNKEKMVRRLTGVGAEVFVEYERAVEAIEAVAREWENAQRKHIAGLESMCEDGLVDLEKLQEYEQDFQARVTEIAQRHTSAYERYQQLQPKLMDEANAAGLPATCYHAFATLGQRLIAGYHRIQLLELLKDAALHHALQVISKDEYEAKKIELEQALRENDDLCRQLEDLWLLQRKDIPGFRGGSTSDEPHRPRFTITEKFIGSDMQSNGIAIDHINKQVALLSHARQEVVSYSQILSSEVCLDSETIISTDRVGQIGGALLGGALSGGFGAIVFAMGAKKKQLSNVKRVELKILTTGSAVPIHLVRFFPAGGFGTPESAIKEATKWHDLLSIAVKEGELRAAAKQPDVPATPSLTTSTPSSLADELKKLGDLKSRGLLTDEEFQKAKAALL